jgi:hypothetical protein
MPASTLRIKERFSVNINATYGLKGQVMLHQECRIANLSSNGAAVLFPRTERLKRGAVIAMDIALPDTIMRIATEAEILWTNQRLNALVSGIKFTRVLSDNMLHQVLNKISHLSDYTELIW